MSFTFGFPHRISMGHRLCGDASPKCQTPHGHNEIIRLDFVDNSITTIDGHLNMAAEFGVMKRDWKKMLDEHFDHAFQINYTDPLRDVFILNRFKVVTFPGDPTTECLAACLLSRAQYMLSHLKAKAIFVQSVTVEETPSNIVRCDYVPEFLQLKSGAGWWNDLDLPPSWTPRTAQKAQKAV